MSTSSSGDAAGSWSRWTRSRTQTGAARALEVVRYARVDQGIEIEVDLAPLRPDAAGRSRQPSGREPDDLLDYRRRFPAFPHDSTADQFFDADRLEAYRALGSHVAERVLAEVGVIGAPGWETPSSEDTG